MQRIGYIVHLLKQGDAAVAQSAHHSLRAIHNRLMVVYLRYWYGKLLLTFQGLF